MRVTLLNLWILLGRKVAILEKLVQGTHISAVHRPTISNDLVILTFLHDHHAKTT